MISRPQSGAFVIEKAKIEESFKPKIFLQAQKESKELLMSIQEDNNREIFSFRSSLEKKGRIFDTFEDSVEQEEVLKAKIVENVEELIKNTLPTTEMEHFHELLNQSIDELHLKEPLGFGDHSIKTSYEDMILDQELNQELNEFEIYCKCCENGIFVDSKNIQDPFPYEKTINEGGIKEL